MNLKNKLLIAALSSITCSSYASDISSIDLNSKVTNSQSVESTQKVTEGGDSEPLPSPTGIEISVGGYGTTLTNDEAGLIDRKAHVLTRHLYEEGELEGLRQLLEENNRAKVLDKAIQDRYPLTPEELLKMKKLEVESLQVINKPLQTPVDMGIRTITLDVDAPQAINLNVSTGFSSSIVFYDQSGSPWEIDGDIINNNPAFTASVQSSGRHVALFEITDAFSESNALINLKDLSTPVVIRLVGSEGKVDSRLSVRIPQFGPLSSNYQPFIHDQLENSTGDIISVLNGDKLPNGRRYELEGVAGEAVYASGSLFIRTRANLLVPPWKRSVTHPSGYKVYEVPPVTALLFSVDGVEKEATIEKSINVDISYKSSIFTE
jgi:hypothetical protein